jgi:hypothetical protein
MVAWIAFALNLALAIIARNRFKNAYNVDGSFGNGIWIALGGAVSSSG